MEEYSIWKHIFEVDDEIELDNLLRLVVVNEDARELVYEKLLYFKNMPNQMVNITIKLDKSINEFPSEKLIEKISSDIVEQFMKNI